MPVAVVVIQCGCSGYASNLCLLWELNAISVVFSSGFDVLRLLAFLALLASLFIPDEVMGSICIKDFPCQYNSI